MRAQSLLLILLISIIFSLSVPYTHCQSSFPFTPFQACPSSPPSRYDISTFSCSACLTNQITSLSNYEACQCQSGYYSVASIVQDENNFTCTSCVSQGLASLRDGSGCMSCGSSTLGLNSQTGDCSCPNGESGYLLIERDETGQLLTAGKQCLSCPNNSLPNPSDLYSCLSCPSAVMTVVSNQCVCPTGYLQDGNACLLQTQVDGISVYPASAAAVVYYQDISITDSSAISASSISSSAPFTAYYLQAAVACKYELDREQCQTLGNLCVLQMYTQSSPACALFDSISNSLSSAAYGFASTQLGWKVALPFLYYSNSDVLTSIALNEQVTLGGYTAADLSTVSVMSYKLAAYTLNGSFIGFTDLSSQLQLCGVDPTTATQFLRFGLNYENSCQLDLLQLLSNTNSTIFYTLFVLDTNSKLYPVPVKMLNYRVNGVLVNAVGSSSLQSATENMDPSSIVLTSRFYLVDADSGRTSLTSQTTMLVYASRVTLRVSMQAGSDTNIYPPLLVIEYSERPTAQIQAGGSSQYSIVSFNAEYLKSNTDLRIAIIALLVVSLVLAVFCCIRNLSVWHQREHHPHPQHLAPIMITLPFITRILLSIFTSFTTFMFISLCSIAFYVFLFYKAQETVFFLLPTMNDPIVTMFSALVLVCWIGKLISVIGTYWKQITYEMILVDWEKSKITDPTNNTDSDSNSHSSQISVWRKLFTANKWNDLQYKRIIHSEVTLILTLFLLRGLNLQNLSAAQPNVTVTNNFAPNHPLLLFALCVFIMLIIVLLQFALKKYILYNYYKHPLYQFLDFLYLSNISIFIFTHSHHAYYLHGKSVFSQTDVTAEQLLLNLKKESDVLLTKQRGLHSEAHTSGTSGSHQVPDNQHEGEVFSLFCSHSFRQQYDVIFADLLRKYLIHQHKLKMKTKQLQHPKSHIPIEELKTKQLQATISNTHTDIQTDIDSESDSQITDRLFKSQQQINDFLIHFIDRNLPEYPYDFSSPQQQSFIRRLLHTPSFVQYNSNSGNIQSVEQQSSIMYTCASDGFVSVLPMGCEFDSILLFILFFNVLLIWFYGNTLVAALGAYLLDRGLLSLRGYFGQLNISRKTLIDQRFLF